MNDFSDNWINESEDWEVTKIERYDNESKEREFNDDMYNDD